MLERVAPVDAERLAQSLTSGIRDVESARPGIGIMHLAALARREPEARAAIERESTAGLDALPEGATRRALQSFPRALRRSRRARGRAVDAAVERRRAPGPAHAPRRPSHRGPRGRRDARAREGPRRRRDGAPAAEAQHRRADGAAAPGRQGAACGPAQGAHARVGDARARDAARGRPRRGPALATPRSGARCGLAQARGHERDARLRPERVPAHDRRGRRGTAISAR